MTDVRRPIQKDRFKSLFQGLGAGSPRILAFVLAGLLAACSPEIDPAILQPDGDVLRANTVIEDPATDRIRVTAGEPGQRPDLPPPSNAGADYRIGPGDKLRVNIFGEPGMTDLTVRVDGQGYIQVPVIELVKVRGMTTRQIQGRLKGL